MKKEISTDLHTILGTAFSENAKKLIALTRSASLFDWVAVINLLALTICFIYFAVLPVEILRVCCYIGIVITIIPVLVAFLKQEEINKIKSFSLGLGLVVWISFLIITIL
jgi:hypothetical protein